MAILFFEDFEEGIAPNTTGLFDGSVGAPAVSTSPALVGTYSMRVGRGGQNVDYVLVHDTIPTDTYTRLYVSGYIQVNTAWPSAGSTEIIAKIVGTTTAFAAGVNLTVDENGKLYIYTNAIFFQLVLGRKEWVELGFECLGGINYQTSLWVNGTLIETRTGSLANAGQYIDLAWIGNANAVIGTFPWDAYYDNIIVSTTRIGTGLTIQTVRPANEDGTENEFTDTGGGAADVDDIPPNTAGTYYVSTKGATNANAENQLWSYGATTATGTVLAVQPMVYMKRATDGSTETASLRWKLPSTGTVDFLTIDAALETTSRFHRACDNLDPDGAAWTPTSANALLVGAQRGASATAYALNLAEAYKSVLFRDVPKDWGGVV